MDFTDFHYQKSPLLICNVWDVASTKVAQKLNYDAIGTSSSAIAAMLGYQDGEEMDFSELLYIVNRIVSNSNIPLSVDLEAGYSRDPKEVTNHIIQLAELGVVGVNLEDSLVNEKRQLISSDSFSSLLSEVCKNLRTKNIDLFINVRTDTFLLNIPNPLEETITRAKKYKAAGANGLFVPCIEKVSDIKSLTENIQLPLNVMCMPELPSFKNLMELGVKRISMGNFVFSKMIDQIEKEFQTIQSSQSFKNLFT